MAAIGELTPEYPLYLPSAGDWMYKFDVEGDPLGPSDELYFLVGNDPLTADKWSFDISPAGDECTIKIESDVVAGVKPGTKYWLILLTEPTAPDTHVEIQTGYVEKPSTA